MVNRKVLQGLFLLCLLGVCLSTFIQAHQVSPHYDAQTYISNAPLSPLTGNWENESAPFILSLDTYYTLPSIYDFCFATFLAQAGDLYYISLRSLIFWDAELYNDSAYAVLLGTFYTVSSSPFSEYLIFSPGHSGWYYLILYCNGFAGKLAILNATPYSANTTQLVVISPETNPVEFFGVDLMQGNYSSAQETLYMRIERGWDYVILPEMYSQFGSTSTYLENGTYGIVIEESCNFCLTGYLYFQENETIPDDPDDENKTDTGENGSILDGITPLFGVGVLVGLCALYKFKKKK